MYSYSYTSSDIEVCTEWLLRNQIFWVIASCGWVIFSRRFEELLRVCTRTHNPRDDGTFIRNVERNLPKHTTTQQIVLLNRETAWKIMKPFNAVSFPVSNVASCPHDLAISSLFSVALSLSHAYRMSDQMCGCVICRFWRTGYVLSLTFRHRASCILGQAFQYSPENAFYIQCCSNMTGTDLCVNKPVTVPVIIEPPCI